MKFLSEKNKIAEAIGLLPGELERLYHRLRVRKLELEAQNSELRELQRELEASCHEYFRLFNLAPVGYFLLDKDGRIGEVNLLGAEMLGLQSPEIKGRNFKTWLDPEDHEKLRSGMNEAENAAGKRASCEVRIRRKYRETFWVKLFIMSAGKRSRHRERGQFFIAAIDIDEMKKMEHDLKKHHNYLEEMVDARTLELNMLNEKLRREIESGRTKEKRLIRSAEEKELLLKEIHHRVKNNLSIVIGLLKLHEKRIGGEAELKSALNDVEMRIRTMMLVHDQLYRTTDIDRIPFAIYLKLLAASISSTLGRPGIKLETELDEAVFHVEKALPCGLIINELLTNAYKHAFRERDKGCVRIGFKKTSLENGDPAWLFELKDDGRGFPPGMEVDKSDSLGMNIIFLLAKQLKAKVDFSGRNGVDFKMVLPADTGE